MSEESAAPDIAAVVFDYGGVMTTPTRASIEAGHRADHIVPASFTRVLKAWLGRDAPAGSPLHRLETGELATVEFERLLAAELETTDGSDVVADGLLSRLFGGVEPNPAMPDLIADLRAVGVRTALLSNSWGSDRGLAYPHEQLSELFETVVISGEVGLRKPDAAIYRMVLDRLDLPAARCVFVDDAEANLRGATAVGLHPVLHTDAAATRAALAEYVPALANESTGARP